MKSASTEQQHSEMASRSGGYLPVSANPADDLSGQEKGKNNVISDLTGTSYLLGFQKYILSCKDMKGQLKN